LGKLGESAVIRRIPLDMMAMPTGLSTESVEN
jgi:hypothetical protein